MRRIDFESRLSAGDVSRHVQIRITRIKPE
jgi:hypothetical protein